MLFSKPVPNSEKLLPVWDGLRALGKSESVCNGDPNQEIQNLRYYWKKNPGRYSNLIGKERWRNVQLTVYKDPETYLNDSRDSLFLFQNGDCNLSSEFLKPETSLSSENAILSFSTTLLSTRGENALSSGLLEISIEDETIFRQTISGNGILWKDLEAPLSPKSIAILNSGKNPKWKIRWTPDQPGMYLFLGHPILFSAVANPDSWGEQNNLVLIVVDALRPDRLGFGGSKVHTSPNIDRLASESINFSQAFANGNWTKPSMLSFFTSQIASELGLGNAWFYSSNLHRKVFYSKNPLTLSNHLRENGFLTASLMNNVFLLDYTGVGVDVGFHKLFQPGKDRFDTELILSESIRFLDENRNRRFFLHININTPHYPYLPGKAYLERLKKETPLEIWNTFDPQVQKYMAEILYTDEVIGKILNKLKDSGMDENTWVVLVSDHGELQEPEHYYHHHFVAENLHAHGETHYEEELKVPWLIRPPYNKRHSIKKFKFEDQVSLLSLFPTLAGALGLPCPDTKCEGFDYSKKMFGEDGPETEEVIYSEGRFSESIRTKDYKLIRRYPGYDSVRFTPTGISHPMPEELYDLKSDPNESHNLAPERNSLLDQARATLSEHSLKKNTFHLRLPSCTDACTRVVDLSVKGGIYRLLSDQPYQILSIDSKKIRAKFEQASNHEVLFQVQTVEPLLQFQLSILKNGTREDYKSGKWGLSSAANLYEVSPEYIANYREPYEFRSSKIPYLYNDAGLAGNNESSEQAALGAEVRKVLESWGYIHQ
ncbi:sulfatase [Leptospira perolatii]